MVPQETTNSGDSADSTVCPDSGDSSDSSDGNKVSRNNWYVFVDSLIR